MEPRSNGRGWTSLAQNLANLLRPLLIEAAEEIPPEEAARHLRELIPTAIGLLFKETERRIEGADESEEFVESDRLVETLSSLHEVTACLRQ